MLTRFNAAGTMCVVLGITLLSYWASKDSRNDAIAIWHHVAAGFLKVSPKIVNLVTEGMIIVLNTIKNRAIAVATTRAHAEGHAEGRSEGHTEGHAEGTAEAKAEFQSWIKRQREAGKLVYDESDPPPA